MEPKFKAYLSEKQLSVGKLRSIIFHWCFIALEDTNLVQRLDETTVMATETQESLRFTLGAALAQTSIAYCSNSTRLCDFFDIKITPRLPFRNWIYTGNEPNCHLQKWSDWCFTQMGESVSGNLKESVHHINKHGCSETTFCGLRGVWESAR